eukprot:1140855-Pelagomonas_calceolata.AAC.9
MNNVLIANLRMVKTSRTKGSSRLWRSLEEEMSVLVPKSTNASTIALEKVAIQGSQGKGLQSRSATASLLIKGNQFMKEIRKFVVVL